MRLSNLVGFVLLFVIFPGVSSALDVYESTLSKNKVLIRVSDSEAQKVSRDQRYATALGIEAAKQMLLLSGIPESITGKVAAAGTAQGLSSKYASDIYSHARKYKQGFALQYQVDLPGVRTLWKASGQGDPFIPGTPAAKAILDIVNRLANYELQKSK